MTNRICKTIRRAFSLPRLKRDMTVVQRQFYRQLKKKYAHGTPAQRRNLLDNVSAFQGTAVAS